MGRTNDDMAQYGALTMNTDFLKEQGLSESEIKKVIAAREEVKRFCFRMESLGFIYLVGALIPLDVSKEGKQKFPVIGSFSHEDVASVNRLLTMLRDKVTQMLTEDEASAFITELKAAIMKEIDT